MKAHILTITLNPTVDYATTSESVSAGPKLRCSEPQIDPGGGGINVSRAIRQLGGQSVALIAIGGATGAHLLQLLALEGVATVAFQGPGETRQSVSVTETESNDQYRFVMPGPSWSEEDVPRALSTVDQATGDGTLVVLSGSQPPGVAKEFPSILAGHIAGRNARIIVDTSGPALFDLAEKSPGIHTLRMNDEECEELAGRPQPEPQDSAAFARELVARGVAENVIVARGADGSVLANAEGAWHAVGEKLPIVSKVGAGDSFVGAYTLALAREWPYDDCLRFGVSSAAAAVNSEATRLCDRDLTERLFESCKVTRL